MTGRSLYRILLRLYPGWFRERYAAQMEEDFSDLYMRMGSTWPGRMGIWIVVGRDLTVSVIRQWLHGLGPSRRGVPKGEPVSAFVQDFTYALRVLRHHPAFALTVVATLALGMGANVAMFTVVDSVLLSSLPYRDADRLVVIWNRHERTGADKIQISGLDLRDYQERSTGIEDFAYIHNSANNTIQTVDGAEQIDVGGVSPNFFRFLGREPFIGRGFTQETEAGNSSAGGASDTREVVISYGLWARAFGSDPKILSQAVHLGNQPVQVIGVMPSDFTLLMPEHDGGMTGGGANDEVDAWTVLPQRVFDGLPRSLGMFRLLGRLRDGVTIEQAQQEMDVVAAQLRSEYQVHEERGMQIDLLPMHADVVGKARPVVLALFGAVTVVMVIACANVANLVLVRAANRQREVSVRAALGATRWRLIRQLLTENSVLAIAGTILGLLLANIAVKTIIALAPADVPLLDRAKIDLSVALFAGGLAVVAIGLFGAVPAMKFSRPDLHTELSDGARSMPSRGQHIRAAIVVAEIALSLVLLVAGGLFTRTFVELQRTRLGFDPVDALTAKVTLHSARGGEAADRRRVYWDNLIRAAEDLPQVERATLVWPLPFAGTGYQLPYSSDARGGWNSGRDVAAVSTVSPGFFETMDARIIDGRSFAEVDLEGDGDIAVVDDIVAERLYPGETAVGRMVWIQPAGGGDRLGLRIIGVVGHMRHESVQGFERESIYRVGRNAMTMALIARTDGDPAGAVGPLRDVARALDPMTPLFDVRTLEDYIGEELAPIRFTMTLASVFALVALVLAAVGLYSVVSYSVSQRAGELGVRMALGAHAGSILRLVLGQGAIMAGTGIVLGIASSIMITRAIRSMLFGVTPTDPLTLVGVSLLLTLVALVASYLPARRAARVDPIRVLRSE